MGSPVSIAMPDRVASGHRLKKLVFRQSLLQMGLAQSTAAGRKKDCTSLAFAVLEPDEARASSGNENTSTVSLLSWHLARGSKMVSIGDENDQVI